MKKGLFVLMTLVFLASVVIAGGGLSPQDEKAIHEAGLSVYPGAVVLDGERAMGIGFVTVDSVDKVRSWYREKNTGWAVFDDGEIWALYDGQPGLNPFEIISKTHVLIMKDEKLPLVHHLEKRMTTEIVIILSSAP